MSRMQELKNKILKEDRKSTDESRRRARYVKDHKHLYAALYASAFLSALAGIAIGLGLRVESGVVHVVMDLPHIFFATLYAVAFPYFFEYGLHEWLMKLLLREPGNKYQEYAAGSMVGLTFIGTALTAFSAMDILVTSLGSFAAFQEIPPVVQQWIAYSLPTMFMLNIFAGEVYRQFAESAKLLRAAKRDAREKEIEADNEVELARINARLQIEQAEADEYANKADQESGHIGKARGSEKWNRDKRELSPSMSLDTPRVEIPEQDPETDSPS